MKKILLSCGLIGALGIGQVYSKSIGEDLTGYFKALNMGANVTEPHAYQAQRAGFYTGVIYTPEAACVICKLCA